MPKTRRRTRGVRTAEKRSSVIRKKKTDNRGEDEESSEPDEANPTVEFPAEEQHSQGSTGNEANETPVTVNDEREAKKRRLRDKLRRLKELLKQRQWQMYFPKNTCFGFQPIRKGSFYLLSEKELAELRMQKPRRLVPSVEQTEGGRVSEGLIERPGTKGETEALKATDAKEDHNSSMDITDTPEDVNQMQISLLGTEPDQLGDCLDVDPRTNGDFVADQSQAPLRGFNKLEGNLGIMAGPRDPRRNTIVTCDGHRSECCPGASITDHTYCSIQRSEAAEQAHYLAISTGASANTTDAQGTDYLVTDRHQGSSAATIQDEEVSLIAQDIWVSSSCEDHSPDPASNSLRINHSSIVQKEEDGQPCKETKEEALQEAETSSQPSNQDGRSCEHGPSLQSIPLPFLEQTPDANFNPDTKNAELQPAAIPKDLQALLDPATLTALGRDVPASVLTENIHRLQLLYFQQALQCLANPLLEANQAKAAAKGTAEDGK